MRPVTRVRSMLKGTTALPTGALTAADAEQLRAREGVEMLVRLDSPEEMERRGGAHEALLLVEGTLLAVTYAEEGWTQQVRRENAERVDLLEAVMQHLAERRAR